MKLLNDRQSFLEWEKKSKLWKFFNKVFCIHLFGYRPIYYSPKNKEHYGKMFCLKCLKTK